MTRVIGCERKVPMAIAAGVLVGPPGRNGSRSPVIYG